MSGCLFVCLFVCVVSSSSWTLRARYFVMSPMTSAGTTLFSFNTVYFHIFLLLLLLFLFSRFWETTVVLPLRNWTNSAFTLSFSGFSPLCRRFLSFTSDQEFHVQTFTCMLRLKLTWDFRVLSGSVVSVGGGGAGRELWTREGARSGWRLLALLRSDFLLFDTRVAHHLSIVPTCMEVTAILLHNQNCIYRNEEEEAEYLNWS